jgi:hypothetical protein
VPSEAAKKKKTAAACSSRLRRRRSNGRHVGAPHMGQSARARAARISATSTLAMP